MESGRWAMIESSEGLYVIEWLATAFSTRVVGAGDIKSLLAREVVAEESGYAESSW